MRHIIVEGCDKTGKTTLCKYLSKQLGLPIKKFSKPRGNPFMEYCDFLVNVKPHIIDRFYLSEIVYSQLKKRKQFIGKTERFLIESAVEMSGCMCIWANGEPEDVLSRIKELGDDYTSLKEAPKILKLYSKETDNSLLFWYNYRIGMDMEYFSNMYEVR